MGDKLWLGLAGRARTPQFSQQSVHADDNDDDDRTSTIRPGDLTTQRTLQRSHTENPLQKNPHKAPRLSRFSSLMGLNGIAKANSPTRSSFEIAPNYPEMIHQRSEAMKARSVSYHEAAHDPSTGIWRKNPDLNTDFQYRVSDATWHNPSLKQMIETVLCTIMTNGISAPIPSHLNSFVAGMIEEFSIQISETKTLQQKYTSLEKTRAKEAQELLKITNEWQEREQNFKEEIKRLERIISDTQKGAESVVLVRAGSVCNRNDGRAFRAKLNRLSRSDEDGNEEDANSPNDYTAPNLRDTIVQNQSRANPEEDVFVNPRSFPDDDYCSKTTKRATGAIPSPPNPEAGNTSGDQNKSIVACGTDAPNHSARNSNSTTASSASGIASSTSSGLVMGHGMLADTIPQNHITPGTTPPRVPPGNDKAGIDHVATLRELMIANGGLPENAIDDESSYVPTIVPPQHLRAHSFDAGDDATKNGKALLIGPISTQHAVENDRRPSTKDSRVTNDQPAAKYGHNRRSSTVTPETRGKDSRNTDGSVSSSANCSPTLRFMGYNHVGRANSNPGDGRGVFIPGYSTPTRKPQSGQEPILTQETIQIARQQRTAHNIQSNGGQVNGRAFLSDEELRSISNEFMPDYMKRTRKQVNGTVPILPTNIRRDRELLAPGVPRSSDN